MVNNYTREDLTRLSAWQSPCGKLTPGGAEKRLRHTAGQKPWTRKKNRRPTADELLAQLHVDHEVVVRFKESATDNQINAVLTKLTPTKKRKIRIAAKEDAAENRLYHVKLPQTRTVRESLKALLVEGSVEYAEPNYIVFPALVPNDPYYNSSGTWGNSYSDLWGAHKLQCDLAWEVSTGSGVVVAVVDSGVDLNHQDLSTNIWTNTGEIAGNGTDDDGNGYIDDIQGWDFIDHDNDPTDTYGHGTHVAGTITAVGNNSIGIIGIAFNSKIMALRGLGTGGSGTIADLADALYYAANNGAKVINASWGGPGDSQTIKDAVNYAHDVKGCVFVAAAGNDDEDAAGFYPARYAAAITVAASDPYDNKAYFSNWGNKIDVAAPGMEILSCRASGTSRGIPVDSNYTRMQGTSMAAPHVSGLCALILADNPSLGPEQVRQALRESADDVGDPGFDIYFGYGRINANAALGDLTDSGIAQITYPTLNETVSDTITVTGTATADNLSDWVLEYGSGTTPSAWTTLNTSSSPVSNGTLHANWDTTALSDGYYTLRLTVNSTLGGQFVDSVGFEVYNAPDPVTVEVIPNTATIKVADSLQLTAVTTGAVDTGYSWQSTDEAIATVALSGLITGKSEGSCQIRATGNDTGVTGTMSLQVVVTRVVVTPSAVTLGVGQSQQFSASTENGLDSDYTWHSSNINVATVSTTGLVTAYSVGGTTVTVTGVDTNCSAEVFVQVNNKCAVTYVVSELAVTPDGAYLLCCASSETKLYVFSVGTLNAVKTIDMPGNPYGVDFDHSGNTAFIACYGYGSVVKVDTQTLEITGEIPTEFPSLKNIRYGRTDRLYVKDGVEGAVNVIDASSGATLAVIGGGMFDVDSSGNNLYQMSSSSPKDLRKWTISSDTPTLAWEVDGHLALLTGGIPVVSPDGAIVYTPRQGWSTDNPERMGTFYMCWDDVALSPDGSRLYSPVGSFMGGLHFTRVRCFETDSYTCVNELPGPNVETGGKLAISPDSRWLYVAYGNSELWLYDLNNDVKVEILPSNVSLPEGSSSRLHVHTSYGLDTAHTWLSSDISVATVDQDGNLAAISSGTALITATGDVTGQSGVCNVSVIPSSEDVTTILIRNRPWCVVSDPSNARVYFSEPHSNTVSVLNTEGNYIEAVVPIGSEPSGLYVTPDSTKLFVALQGGSHIGVIDLSTLQVIEKYPVGVAPVNVCATDQKAYFVTEAEWERLLEYDFSQGTVVELEDIASASPPLAMRTDWTRLYATDYEVIEYDTTQSPAVMTRTCSGGPGNNMMVSHDNSRLYTSTGRVVDMATFTRTDYPHLMGVAAALSSDSKYLISGSYSTVKVADTSGMFIRNVIDVQSSIWDRCLALSSDGSKIVIARHNRELEIRPFPSTPQYGGLACNVTEFVSGIAVPDAIVTLKKGSWESSTTSDSEGNFYYYMLEPSTYVLTIQKGDYSTVYQTNIEIIAGEMTGSVAVKMIPISVVVLTESLPDGCAGKMYSEQLVASGGSPPYSWSLDAGSGPLPAGLSLNADGTITGSPQETGAFPFTVKAVDSLTIPATKDLSVTVVAPQISINSVSESLLGPNITTSTINWQSEVDATYHIEVGGNGTPGTGTQVETGSCFADTPIDTAVDESEIPDSTTQNIYVIIEAGTETFSNYTTITDDHTAPSSSVTSPGDGTVRGSVDSIAGAAADAGGSNVDSVAVCIYDGTNYYDSGSGFFDSAVPVWIPVTTGTTSWSYDSSSVPWADFTNYTVQSMAGDVIGNVETPGTGITFTFNSQVPTVTINSVSHSVVGPSQSTTVDWVSDMNGTYYVEVGGTGAVGSGTLITSGLCTSSVSVNTIIYDTDLADDALSTVWFMVDTGANVGNQSVQIHDDQTAPSSAITEPADGTSPDTATSVAGTASDSGGSVVSVVEVSISNGLDYYDPVSGDFTSAAEVWLAASGTTLWSFDTGSVPWEYKTVYSLRSRAADAVGNTETPGTGVTFTFTGNHPPVLLPSKSKGGCALSHDASPDPIWGLLPAGLLLVALLVVLRKRRRNYRMCD